MAIGSYIRFFLGLLLSLEVVRVAVFGGGLGTAAIMSVVYILLTISYFVFHF